MILYPFPQPDRDFGRPPFHILHGGEDCPGMATPLVERPLTPRELRQFAAEILRMADQIELELEGERA